MKTFILAAFLGTFAVALAGCDKDGAAPQTSQTCADEQTLATYQSQEAVVSMTQLDTYCLVADPADIAQHSYHLENYLVPVPALPAQYQVEGLRVVFSGRKKSCYGLTTLPMLRGMFGYKLEVTDIQISKKQ